MKWTAITVALLVGFGAGMAAQRGSTGITMRGTVMDGNTIAEPIEYWEVRAPSGDSVVITGRKELPVVQWLRQAKGRLVLLSIEPSGTAPAGR
jgi:hypothetical protein